MDTDEQVQLELDADAVAPMEGVDTRDVDAVLYKKWFQAAGIGGFLTVGAWSDVGMLSIDIGEVKDKKLTHATKVWVPALKVAAYLTAWFHHGAEEYKDQKFTHYGGTMTVDGPLSRVFTIAPDGPGFRFSCAHFRARRSPQGAYLPNMSDARSTNFIKVNRVEVGELRLALDLALGGWAASDPHWITNLNRRHS